jgi:hypothetical protein
LVPVKPSSSRRANNKVVPGSESKVRLFPLICAWMGTAVYPQLTARPGCAVFGYSLLSGEKEDKSLAACFPQKFLP